MRILLLSISPNRSGNRQRTDYLADALRLAGHDPIIVRWVSWNSPSLEGAPGELSIRILPSASRILGGGGIPFWNQVLVHYKISMLVRRLRIDAIIWPNNWYAIGYPPRKFPVPVLIDYFDRLERGMEERYFHSNRVVLSTSKELQIDAGKWTESAHWIPTPIDPSRFHQDRLVAKENIGLDSSTFVVSLIGLTAAPTLYFIDAIDDLAIPDMQCLLVGEGELLDSIRNRIRQSKHPERFQVLGKLPYDEVAKYFCATDVGLYPGEDTEYYHSACPIKVLEYLAAGSMVVTNHLRELNHWGYSNIVMVDPTAQGFKNGIEEARRRTWRRPDLGPFCVEQVSRKFDQVLDVAHRHSLTSNVTNAERQSLPQ